MSTLILTQDDVEKALSIENCIPAVEAAMIASAEGKSLHPPRQAFPLMSGGMLGVMPGETSSPALYGTKVVGVKEHGAQSKYQSHQGVVATFDVETGLLNGLVEAGSITAIRTAAASAAATKVLAREDASVLAIVGAGVQAVMHLEAMRLVRPIKVVRLWARDLEQSEALAARFNADNLKVEAIPRLRDATKEADIICTVTAATEAFLFNQVVSKGVHINAVGASTAAMCEIGANLIAMSRLFADVKENVAVASGEFVRAKEAGVVTDNHILGDIGSVIKDPSIGRLSDEDITLYKSLGVIDQDLAAAHVVLEYAREHGLGTEIDLTAVKR
ncbi:MAG: ornithine cyclodeaminase family protein [Halioglobus sp.]